MEKNRGMMEWIKCSEKFPEEGELVLCWNNKKNKCEIDWIFDGKEKLWAKVLLNDKDQENITHWIPLPEGPTVWVEE